MNLAAIDVGSNTVRMLIAKKDKSLLVDPHYYRQVTRLAGGYRPSTGLSSQSMERTLRALEPFATLLNRRRIQTPTIVGTAALRCASNSTEFIARVKNRVGLNIEIIDGDREAELSCGGILSVLDPLPKRALLFDIGGGSTEIILFDCGRVCLQLSLPLGVVRLLEDCPQTVLCADFIHQTLSSFVATPLWQKWQKEGRPIELVGTAGTVTTLAALKLKMTNYVGQRVNNLVLERSWLQEMMERLQGLSLEQRLNIPGMEEGRGDLILPGLQVVLALLEHAKTDALRVSDAGLLEGLLLENF